MGLAARMALFAVLAAGLGGVVRGRGVSPGGSCVEYPAEGGYCSEFGLGGEQVYLFDGVGSISERSEEVGASMAPILRAASAVATADCVFHMKRLACVTAFPLCDANENPRLPCKSQCDSFALVICEKAYATARLFGMTSLLINCASDVAGGESTVTNGLMPDYLAGWEGNLIFQEEETYTDDALPGSPSIRCLGDTGIDTSAACKPLVCHAPNQEVQFPHRLNESLGSEFRNPEDYDFCFSKTYELDCDRCFSKCEFPCKYDFLFSEGEFAVLATVQWLPGLLALPLNVLVATSEILRVRKMKRAQREFPERLVLLSAVFGVLLFLIDGLPTMIMGDDVRCAGLDTYSSVGNYDGSSWCWFAKIKVHLLQALMFTVVCTLYRLRMQLKATLSMARYRPSAAAKRTFVFVIFVLPLILALGTFLFEADQLYLVNNVYRAHQDMLNGGVAVFEGISLHRANNLRYTYSCGPKMHNITEEILVYQGPLMLAGLMCMGLSVSLMRIVGKMGKVASSNGIKNDDDVAKALRTLAMSMVRFAGINVALVLLNAISTVLFLPQAAQFGIDMEDWNFCVQTGVDIRDRDLSTRRILNETTAGGSTLAENEAICGRLADFSPSMFMMVLGQIAQTLPPLAFGLLFAIPALKLVKATTARIRPSFIGTRSVRPSFLETSKGESKS